MPGSTSGITLVNGPYGNGSAPFNTTYYRATSASGTITQPIAGNVLVMVAWAIGTNGNTVGVPTITTTTTPASFTAINSVSTFGSNLSIGVFYRVVQSTDRTSVNVNNTNGTPGWMLWEFSGVNTSNVFDLNPISGGTASSSYVSPYGGSVSPIAGSRTMHNNCGEYGILWLVTGSEAQRSVDPSWAVPNGNLVNSFSMNPSTLTNPTLYSWEADYTNVSYQSELSTTGPYFQLGTQRQWASGYFSLNPATLYSSGQSSAIADSIGTETTVGIETTGTYLTTAHGSSGTSTTETVTGATVVETATDVNNAISGVQALVGQPINMLGSTSVSSTGEGVPVVSISSIESMSSSTQTTSSTAIGSSIQTNADTTSTIRNTVVSLFSSMYSVLRPSNVGQATSQSVNSIISSTAYTNAQASTNSIVGSTISSTLGVTRMNASRRVFKTMSVLATSYLTKTTSRAKPVVFMVSTTLTVSRQRLKKILFAVVSRLTQKRRITKDLSIKSQDLFSHLQTYTPGGWSIPDDSDPNDFAIADEQEEAVPPTITTFDYAMGDSQDPTDTGVPSLE